MKLDPLLMSPLQQFVLVGLRTLIGWHFCYEGYVKLLHPAWSLDGHPLPGWSSAGYLKAATGPFAAVFHALSDAAWLAQLDFAVALLLLVIGISLLLGLFTQSGCAGAAAMLSIFYLSAIPLGLPDAHTEGSYLIVNKNLIELASVAVLLVFRTGRIAGLDGWLGRARVVAAAAKEATV